MRPSLRALSMASSHALRKRSESALSTLLEVFSGLLSKRHTIVVVEHNLDVIRSADWVIDLGPDGGQAGGHVLVEGTPTDILKCRASHTGQALAARFRQDASR